jgi:hypothetical protein
LAKSVPPKSGPSRIRFVMLEADVQDGDLSQITQAIQNAFRSPSVVARTPASQTHMISVGTTAEPLGEDDDVIEVANAIETAPTENRQPRKRAVAKTPDVLNDIDTDRSPTLKDFVAQFDVKTGVDRYLVIALWFRDARATSAITVDHVYTCFRLLGWSTSSADFSKPLRNLRDEQSMSGDAKGYSLTLVGAGKIEAKKRGNT